MALVGGGGAGNVAGSNPTGTGTILNYIGDHCFAFSGFLATSNNEVTHLEFDTGLQYIVSEITCVGSVKQADIPDGDHSVFILYMNDEAVGMWKVSTIAEGMPTVLTVPTLIPPYTKVKITCDSYNPGADYFTQVQLVGRVYA